MVWGKLLNRTRTFVGLSIHAGEFMMDVGRGFTDEVWMYAEDFGVNGTGLNNTIDISKVNCGPLNKPASAGYLGKMAAVAVGSKVLKTTAVNVIHAATPNLFL